MATKKFLSNDGLLYLWTLLKTMLGNKVDKDGTKVLSTNDYTTAEKNKLAGVAEGANKYVHPDTSETRHVTDTEKSTWNAKAGTSVATASANGLMSSADKTKLDGVAAGADVSPIAGIKLNGTLVTPSSKVVNLTVITESTVDSKIATAVGAISKLTFQIVSTLPTTGDSSYIYLVPKTGSTNDVYDEWAWINSKWEHLGSTAVDLSGYLQSSDLVAITNTEIDTIVAS